MRIPNGLPGAGAAILILLVADLLVPESGISSILTHALGISSIGVAIWTLALIAR